MSKSARGRLSAIIQIWEADLLLLVTAKLISVPAGGELRGYIKSSAHRRRRTPVLGHVNGQHLLFMNLYHVLLH